MSLFAWLEAIGDLLYQRKAPNQGRHLKAHADPDGGGFYSSDAYMEQLEAEAEEYEYRYRWESGE